MKQRNENYKNTYLVLLHLEFLFWCKERIKKKWWKHKTRSKYSKLICGAVDAAVSDTKFEKYVQFSLSLFYHLCLIHILMI